MIEAGPEIVRMEAISIRFPGVQALDGVDLACRRGEIHALVGENGAGKSTLIKILGGVYPPDSGSILLHGEKISFKNPQAAQRAGIHIVHQEFSLVPYLSVTENILLGQEETNGLGLIKASLMRRLALEALELVRLKLDPESLIVHLSASQQKLVEIAKALIAKPDILVVDEPTAPLNREETASFFETLRELKKGGATVIYISHRLEELFQIADRVTILKDGRKVATREMGEIDEDGLIRMMIGRALGDMFPRKGVGKAGEKVLSVRNLERKGEIQGVSFDLHKGEVLGIAGLKGQGQEALLKTVFGVLAKNRGELAVDSAPAKINRPAQAIAAGMALVTDKRGSEGLCPLLSVRHNLSLPTLEKRQTMSVIDRRREREAVEAAVRSLNIATPSLNKLVKYLSGGNQQKTVIGKWLAAEPKIVLFIDPTVGIDVGAKTELYRLIRALAEEREMGVLLVTSDMLELLGLCDRILVMYEGRIVSQIPGPEATEEKIMRAAVGRSGSSGPLAAAGEGQRPAQ